MIELLHRFLPVRVGSSAHVAKSRLKSQLVRDQIDLTPSQIEVMQAEILAVCARYSGCGT